MRFSHAEWIAVWAGRFSLLPIFYDIRTFKESNEEEFGYGFSKTLFVQEKGTGTCYQLTDELEAYQENLRKKIEKDPSLVKKWSEDLIVFSDRLKQCLVDHPSSQNVREMANALKKSQAYQQANKYLGNLPLSSEQFAVVLDARRKTEGTYLEVQEWFERLAGESTIDDNLFLSMNAAEFEEYLETGLFPDLEILRDRFESQSLLFEGRTHQYIFAEFEIDDVIEVKGQSAYPGIVQMSCMVLRKVGPFAGGILVTTMTTPDFLPIMKQADAIVTDVGGMLSHAAVTARELKIPCVVGTKIATQIFKDGDLLEVDATNGIVRKMT